MKLIIITRSLDSINIFLKHVLFHEVFKEVIVLEYPKSVSLNKKKYNLLQRFDINSYRVIRKILNIVNSKKKPETQNITHFKLSNLDEVIKYINDYHPTLVFLKNAPILKLKILDRINVEVLNGHSGFLPDYKGASCGLWPIVNKENKIGVTIHEVTSVLDAGRIIKRDLISLDKIPKSPLYASYINDEQQKLLVRLLIEYINNKEDALNLVIDNNYSYYPLPGLSNYFKGYLNLVLDKIKADE